MSKIYSPEELNRFSRKTLVAVILSMQDQLNQLNANMERLIEQIADANNKRYGRSSEKLDVIAGQLGRVDKRLTPQAPHRSVRAPFTHTAPHSNIHF